MILFVIVFIICQIATTSSEILFDDDLSESSPQPLTLEEYFNGIYSAEKFEGEWVDGSDHLVKIKTETGLVFYDVQTGKNETIVSFDDITSHWDIYIAEVLLSSDMRFALIKNMPSSEWRATPCSQYLIYDIEAKNCSELGHVRIGPNGEHELECIQHVKWTPTGRSILYVAGNNIFYIENARKSTKIRQITFDGNEDAGIFNGITNWASRGDEEEDDNLDALWISQSSSFLTFFAYNESLVQEIQWPIYGDLDDNNLYYTEYRKVRYSKPGLNSTIVDVYVVSLSSEKSKLKKIKFLGCDEQYLFLKGPIMWTSNSKFITVTWNRQQTTAVWHLCQAKSASCKQIYTYTFEHGWADDVLVAMSRNGKNFVFNRPLKQANETLSYINIVLVSLNESHSETVLNKGRMSVIEICGWDEDNHKIYFTATYWDGFATDPSESHVYHVSDDGTQNPHCITCGMKNSAGELCRANSAEFSDNFTYFIHTCLGPGIPEMTTRYTRVMKTGKSVEFPGPTLVNNSHLRNVLNDRLQPITKEYNVLVEDGFFARVRLYLPINFDPNTKYPLLVSVYAGPGSQSISQAYEPSWEKTLVSSHNVIVAYIDGRGSGGQSVEQMFSVHRRLGTVEVEDQITVTKWLIENEPLIDANRTGIWGWSYGGFVVIKALQIDSENVFKCGVAGAPVTNWQHYNSVYSECYMGLPSESDNFEGYRNSDLTLAENLENMRNKEFLIVHGLADNVVPFQHSMLLARSLQKNDILFQQLSYPDVGHSPAQDVSKHVHKSVEHFLLRSCFRISE